MPAKKEQKHRVYKGEIPQSVKIDEGDTVQGIFLGMKEITLKDQNSGADKEVRAYTFRNEKNEKFTLLGRTGLDFAMDDMLEHEGGIERAIGLNVAIARQKDTRLRGGKSFGNYTVEVWED